MVRNLNETPIPSIDLVEAELEVGSFKEIPISALSAQTRRQLSRLLNSRKYLLSESGHYRDWRGIATLTNQKDFFDESAISGSDPTSKVLDEWYNHNEKEANFAKLQQYLGVIDRWDACDDIYENLVEDAKNYKTKLRIEQTRAANLASRQEARERKESKVPAETENDILTKDDAELYELGLPTQLYHAFLLYVDCDVEYATEIKQKLEEEKYKLRICTKDDILSTGNFIHKAMTQVIDERCKYLIVILTKEFRKSPENEFYMNHAHAGAIVTAQSKLIPLIYDDDVKIPRTLIHITHLRKDHVNFWERLALPLRCAAIADIRSTNNVCINIRTADQLSDLPTTTPPIDIPSINVTPVPDEADSPSVSSAPVKESRFLKRQTIANGNHMHHNYHNGHLSTNNIHKNNKHSSSNSNINIKNDSFSSKFMQVKGFVLRHANSTSQLNNKNYKENNISSSDVSISSHCSESQKPKKKKSKFKFIKRMIGRSNTKLQTAV